MRSVSGFALKLRRDRECGVRSWGPAPVSSFRFQRFVYTLLAYLLSHYIRARGGARSFLGEREDRQGLWFYGGIWLGFTL